MCFKDPSHSRKSKLYYLPHFLGNHPYRSSMTFYEILLLSEGNTHDWVSKRILWSLCTNQVETITILCLSEVVKEILNTDFLRINCATVCRSYIYKRKLISLFFFFSVCIATWRGIYIVCLWYIHETEESIVYLCWVSIEHGISRLWLQMIKRITFYTWGSDIVTFLSCTCTVVLGDTLHLV